jgi:DNA modification methylase
MSGEYDLSSRINEIIQGDAFQIVRQMPTDSINAVITSPPYWGLRDYQIDDQFGVENNASDYIQQLTSLGDFLSDVVVDEGSLWLNLGDTYNGTSIIRQESSANPDKGDDRYDRQLADNRDDSGVKRRSAAQFGLPRQNRLLIPERVAMAIQDAGWILRDRVIWHKPTPKPEGRVTSRLTQSHEVVFRFVQQESHKFYRDRLSDPVDVWQIKTADSDHPAPMPSEIARRCVKLTTDRGDTVLDPFCGSGTVCSAAYSLDRDYLGVEICPEFAELSRQSVESTPKDGLSRWTGVQE